MVHARAYRASERGSGDAAPPELEGLLDPGDLVSFLWDTAGSGPGVDIAFGGIQFVDSTS